MPDGQAGSRRGAGEITRAICVALPNQPRASVTGLIKGHATLHVMSHAPGWPHQGAEGEVKGWNTHILCNLYSF